MKRGNLLGPLIIRRDVPGLISFVEGYCPMELHISAPKKKPNKKNQKKTNPPLRTAAHFFLGGRRDSAALYCTLAGVKRERN